MNRSYKYVFGLILSAASIGISFGQGNQDTKRSNAPDVFEDQSSKVLNVQNLVQSVASFRDEKIAASTLAQIADLSWKLEKDYARSIFRISLSKLEIGKNETAKEIAIKTAGSRRVIALIAKHDSNWARDLINSFSEDSKERARANLEIAKDLLEEDAKTASDFAAQSLQNEITPGLISFLKTLKQNDQSQADRLFLQILSRYSGHPTPDPNQFALLGTYLFKSAHPDVDAHTILLVRVGNIGMPDFSANQSGVSAGLVQSYIRSAITLLIRPSLDIGQNQVKYALGYLLVPKAQEFAPGMVGELLGAMHALASSVPQEYTTEAAYKNIGKKSGSPSDRIEEIDKIPDSETRNRLFLDVVFQAYRRNDFEIASLATSKIDDEKIQSELETLILFGEANRVLKGTAPDLLNGLQIVDKVPNSFEKALLWLSLSSLAEKAKNRQIYESALNSASDVANVIDSEESPYLLLHISGRMKDLPNSYSASVFVEAVRGFNKHESIKDPVLERRVTLEPLRLPFSLSVKDVNLDFRNSFAKAISTDDEAALLMVHDFKDERLKGFAYVTLLKRILAKKPDAKLTPVKDRAQPTRSTIGLYSKLTPSENAWKVLDQNFSIRTGCDQLIPHITSDRNPASISLKSVILVMFVCWNF